MIEIIFIADLYTKTDQIIKTEHKLSMPVNLDTLVDYNGDYNYILTTDINTLRNPVLFFALKAHESETYIHLDVKRSWLRFID